MASLSELEQALIGAHDAGDTEAATVLANEILKVRQEQGPMGQVKKVAGGAVDLAKSAATGAANAVAGTVGLPGDIYNAARNTIPGMESWPAAGGSEDVRGFMENVLGTKFHKPENAVQKFISSGTEGAASIFPNSKASAIAGTLMGIGGEAGAQILKDYPTVGRLLGMSVPAGFAAVLGGRTPKVVKATQSYIDEVGGEPALRAMEAKRGTMEKTLGGSMLLPQAAESKALDGIVRAITSMEAGAPTRKVLEGEIPLAERLSRSITSGMPGEFGQMDANMILRKGGEIAPERMADVTRISSPVYNAQIGTRANAYRIADELAFARDQGGWHSTGSLAGEAVENIVKTLRAGPEFVEVRELDSISRTAKSAAMKTTDSVERKALNKIAEVIHEGTPQLSTARAGHEMLTKAIVEPTTKGPVGQLFPPKMVGEGVGSFDHFVGVIEKADAKDIAQIGRELNAKDPTLFPNIVKKEFQGKIEASLANRENIPSGEAFGELAKNLAGRYPSQQRAAFEEKIRQIALGQGKNPDMAVTGANNVIDTLYGVSRTRGSSTPGAESMWEASQTITTNMLKGMGFLALPRRVGWMIERGSLKRLAGDLSDAFTTPEGVDKLIAIAKFSRAKHITKTLLRGGNVAATSQMQNEYVRSPEEQQ